MLMFVFVMAGIVVGFITYNNFSRMVCFFSGHLISTTDTKKILHVNADTQEEREILFGKCSRCKNYVSF